MERHGNQSGFADVTYSSCVCSEASLVSCIEGLRAQEERCYLVFRKVLMQNLLERKAVVELTCWKVVFASLPRVDEAHGTCPRGMYSITSIPQSGQPQGQAKARAQSPVASRTGLWLRSGPLSTEPWLSRYCMLRCLLGGILNRPIIFTVVARRTTMSRYAAS